MFKFLKNIHFETHYEGKPIFMVKIWPPRCPSRWRVARTVYALHLHVQLEEMHAGASLAPVNEFME